MKILIFGAGVIGTIYGYASAQAGNDVTYFVRPGKKERYQQGVDLGLLDERKVHPANNQTHYNLIAEPLSYLPLNVYQDIMGHLQHDFDIFYALDTKTV